ncbi:MAG: ATP-binding protein [Candidatus Gracilibacteria bacterium]|nr:ATP-binding protein [Candidatus Gracilibacteria bacterium]
MKEIVSGVKFNFGFFGWDLDDEKMFKSNIFGVMLEKLKKAKEKGIQPVIILDEFQYLKNIFFDKENNLFLIEELFKFFISITKQYNLAHVVCLTSDSYYMEELYSDTKLSNTSDFYLMEHLSKKDIFYWLEEKEKIDKKIVEKIWKNLGGSVWEIWQVLVSYKNTGSYKEKLDDLLQVKYGLLLDWYNNYNEKVFDIKVEEKTQKEIKYKLNIN